MSAKTSNGPYADSAIARFLDKHIDSLRGIVTQADIAKALDYQRPNVISMFKTGNTRVPLDKIPALAEVLTVDPALLMRLGLEQYWPGRRDALAKIFSQLVSQNELKLVETARAVIGDEDYSFRKETLEKIKEIIVQARQEEGAA